MSVRFAGYPKPVTRGFSSKHSDCSWKGKPKNFGQGAGWWDWRSEQRTRPMRNVNVETKDCKNMELKVDNCSPSVEYKWDVTLFWWKGDLREIMWKGWNAAGTCIGLLRRKANKRCKNSLKQYSKYHLKRGGGKTNYTCLTFFTHVHNVRSSFLTIWSSSLLPPTFAKRIPESLIHTQLLHATSLNGWHVSQRK